MSNSQQGALAADSIHASDCAVHNAPALPVGPCDCDAVPHTHTWKWANLNDIDYCKCGATRPHEAGTR